MLNRQELENFVDYIYSDTEIELKDELLIIAQVDRQFQCLTLRFPAKTHCALASDPHRRFGFWVAEPHLRQHLVNRITE